MLREIGLIGARNSLKTDICVKPTSKTDAIATQHFDCPICDRKWAVAKDRVSGLDPEFLIPIVTPYSHYSCNDSLKQSFVPLVENPENSPRCPCFMAGLHKFAKVKV
jgi:hypothetical protein